LLPSTAIPPICPTIQLLGSSFGQKGSTLYRGGGAVWAKAFTQWGVRENHAASENTAAFINVPFPKFSMKAILQFFRWI
jgi:hypothetical protein